MAKNNKINYNITSITTEALLETSVTNAVSAKLNLNITYDDEEEEEEEVHEVQKTTEVIVVNKKQAEKQTEFVYVAEDDTEEEEEEETSDVTEDVSQTGYSQENTGMNTSKNSDSNMSDSGKFD